MKLGTIKNGSRDGRLIVVDRELSHYIFVPDIANTLQQALDHWDELLPRLQLKYAALNEGKIIGLPFEEKKCAHHCLGRINGLMEVPM